MLFSINHFREVNEQLLCVHSYVELPWEKGSIRRKPGDQLD